MSWKNIIQQSLSPALTAVITFCLERFVTSIFTGSFVSPNFWGIIYVGGIVFPCSIGLRKLWLRRPRVIFRLLYPRLSICGDFLNRKAENEPLPEDWRRIVFETCNELSVLGLLAPTHRGLSYLEMAEYLAHIAQFVRKNDFQGALEFAREFREFAEDFRPGEK